MAKKSREVEQKVLDCHRDCNFAPLNSQQSVVAFFIS